MSTDRHIIDVQGIAVEVVRKDIKNLHVGVYPPHGRVRVATPQRLDDDAVRLAVITRLPWIRRQRARFEAQERQSAREMVTGESHYFQGRRYRLDVLEHDGRPQVSLRNNTTIAMHVRAGTDAAKRASILEAWYRARLREQVAPLLTEWEPRVGAVVRDVRIKRMKTRWGSCNAAAQRIWLNVHLAKKPAACLEYVLVHEMVHLLERHHNDRFRAVMDELLPTWRLQRDELNSSPLAHEEWEY